MVFQNETNVGSTNYPRLNKSPFFSFSNAAAIPTNTFKLFDFHRDNTSTEKYGSYNNMSISNGSTNNILIYPNQDKSQGGILVGAGITKELDQRIMPSITSLLIENAGSGEIAINEIRLTIWKDYTELQSIASRVHERLFSSEPNPFIKDFSTVLLNFRKKE